MKTAKKNILQFGDLTFFALFFVGCTVWKFMYFSITQILREINFGDGRSAKYAILTHLEALNLDSYEILHFLKAEIYQFTKFRAP